MSETTDDVAIEQFAALVEETGTGRHHRRPDDADPALAGLVGLTLQLAVAYAEPRAAFRAGLLDRLLIAYAEEYGPVTPTPTVRDEQPAIPWPVNAGTRVPVAPRPRQGVEDALPEHAGDAGLANARTQVVRVVRPRLGRRARLAAFLGVAGALAISGVSMASSDALPGEALYRVKNIGEQAQLWFAGSDADRGHLHLDFARVRLVEARQVAPEAVGDVLAAMDRETTDGARLLFTAGSADGAGQAGIAEIDSVTAFVQQQRADLNGLRASVRGADEPARRSLDLLATIEIRANELKAALAGGCAVASVDRFGPDPTC